MSTVIQMPAPAGFVPPAKQPSAAEVSNRFWKAARFAAVLHACKITSEKVYGFELSNWEVVAKELNEKIPSPLTRFEIVSLLELLEEADANERYKRIAGLGGCA